MDATRLSRICRALSDPTRARILQFLVGCCCAVEVNEEGGVAPASGPTAGQVCCHVSGGEKVTSTVSFHLKELREGGLITMEKKGKQMICAPNWDTLGELAAYLAKVVEREPCC